MMMMNVLSFNPNYFLNKHSPFDLTFERDLIAKSDLILVVVYYSYDSMGILMY